MTIEQNQPNKKFNVSQLETLDFPSLEEHIAEKEFEISQNDLEENGWLLMNSESLNLINKIQNAGISLKEYTNGKIYRGVLTGLNDAFVIDAETRNRLIAEDPKSAELIKPFLAGRDVKRYGVLTETKFLILMPKGWTHANSSSSKNKWAWLEEKYPAIAKHLLPFEAKGKKRCDQGDFWWELRTCDYYAEFEKAKIIYPNICRKPEFTFDNNHLFTNQKCFIISLDDKFLLGILNSSVFNFLFHKILPKLRGGFFEPGYVFLKDFPIPKLDLSKELGKQRHTKLVDLTDQILSTQKQIATAKIESERKLFQQKAAIIDKQINALVYDLYDLTEEEIAIIED